MALTKLANQQWGVVARRQLAALEVTPAMVKARVARGSLTRLHRGVYAVGHRRLTPRGRALAAVLAVGPGAALSHRSAAWLHELAPLPQRRIEVTTAARATAGAAIDLHRSTALDARDLTVVDGIPVTTLARTLVDLASVVPRDRLATAVAEAERRLLLDVDALTAAIERTRGRRGPGHARLRAVLADHAAHGIQLDRSELERRFLALVRRADLPRPRLNHVVGGLEIDAVWPARRLAVELDGWAFHRHRRAFQRDRDKGNTLAAAGWTLLRFTHRDVAGRPEAVASQLRRVLADD